ncbi:glycosyltransferase family 4 protein [Rhodocytophaga rosea]|uniref:Glycosyltransferase family 4 protein n=1 Tax=Rhodocytophaga rosea TaxID=2704465 RepID=A0A6C0GSU9_9BACT|nr:glycosyltransferase family 4 protein [Rhodocytophaga rosea]QHT70550.1 glycosyltransferase family 4 protein [Rhodocytophaga rosea]
MDTTKNNNQIKVKYILSNINKALAFEWIAEELDRSKIHLSFILLNPDDSALEQHLKAHQIKVDRIRYKGKKDLPNAIYRIYTILRKEHTQIVHCHMFDACVAGLTAARLAGVRKRIYTRHHATFHQQYFPRAVWYDKFISQMATDVVAISENVRQTLIGEGVNASKIRLIHHGFRLEGFEKTDQQKVLGLKRKYNPNSKSPVIGVISRYFELKGIQYIIPALKQILHTYPDALLILANTSGNYTAQIKSLLQEIPSDNYIEIPFEKDIFSLYQLFDIFVHVPIDPQIEAFGQTYVEALAAGIPSVFTKSGVATEFIKDGQNAMVVPFKSSQAIADSFYSILENPNQTQNIVWQGKTDVKKMFTLGKMVDSLEELYGK